MLRLLFLGGLSFQMQSEHITIHYYIILHYITCIFYSILDIILQVNLILLRNSSQVPKYILLYLILLLSFSFWQGTIRTMPSPEPQLDSGSSRATGDSRESQTHTGKYFLRTDMRRFRFAYRGLFAIFCNSICKGIEHLDGLPHLAFLDLYDNRIQSIENLEPLLRWPSLLDSAGAGLANPDITWCKYSACPGWNKCNKKQQIPPIEH